MCSLVSLVLTTSIRSESDLEVIQGPHSSCTQKLVGSSNEVNFFVNIYPAIPKIITSKSLTPSSASDLNHLGSKWINNLRIPPLKIYKHSPHCENALIFESTNNLLPLYPSFKSAQLRSLLQFPFNINPQFIHHIFIGKEGWIRKIFQQEDVKILHYKTGIATENSNNSTSLILEERGFPPKLTSFKADQYLKEQQDRFDILRQRHFNINSFHLKLQVVRDRNGNPIGGMGYNFVKTFTEYYNSTFDLSHEGAKNNKQMSNGSWNGLLGSLIDSRADIAIWLGNTETRSPYADFTTPAINLPLVFFTSLPRASVTWYGILFVFSKEVWVCIALSIVSVIPVYYFKIVVENHSHTGTEFLYLSIILPVCAILQEARNIPVQARGLSGLFLFYAIIVGTFFNSNLISFLTLPVLEHAPETPDELWKMLEYDIRYLYYPGAACDLFFSQTKSPMFMDIKKRMKYTPPSSATHSMMETAVMPKMAQLHYDLAGHIIVAENLTFHPAFVPVKMSRTPILDIPIGFVLRKYSQFTETVSYNVGKLQNTGHFKKWFDQTLDIVRGRGISWLKEVKTEERREELGYKVVELTEDAMSATTKPFTLVHFGLMFCCLVCGLSLGLACFLVEIFAPYSHKKSKIVMNRSMLFVKRTPNCNELNKG
ncbi:unnamed protein product [Allacma fusca]|uniref:Ionotropic glutamate receptor L-glutamate and glycine-binding domain-containing protein n=1 Tax=Allacma fusca TaxID=39272 RepID=A0A8J2K7D9_9HEXA|nr:unnamed protein product [Allacma fusca]